MDEDLRIRIGAVITGVQEAIASVVTSLKGLSGAANKAQIAFELMGKALVLTGIGAVIIGIVLLVKALRSSKDMHEKLQPLLIGFQQILKGIYRAVEPVVNVIIELALKALPYVTKGIGIFYSVLYGLFRFIKDVGPGIGDILIGIFTFNYAKVKAGVAEVKAAFNTSVDAAKAAFGRYEAGTKEVTAIEQEELDKREKAAEEAEKKRQQLLKRRLTAQKAAIDEELKLTKQSLSESFLSKQKQSLTLGAAIKLVGVTDAETIDSIKTELKTQLDAVSRDFKNNREAAGQIDFTPILLLDRTEAGKRWSEYYRQFAAVGFEEAAKTSGSVKGGVSITPSLKALRLMEDLDDVKKKASEAAKAFNVFLQPAIDTAFTALGNGSNIIKALGQSFKALIVQMGLAVAKALVLAAIISAIPGGGAALDLGSKFGSIFKNLFKGNIGLGNVSSPTFGGSFSGSGLNLAGAVSFNIRGTDLVAVMNRGNAQIGRIG